MFNFQTAQDLDISMAMRALDRIRFTADFLEALKNDVGIDDFKEGETDHNACYYFQIKACARALELFGEPNANCWLARIVPVREEISFYGMAVTRETAIKRFIANGLKYDYKNFFKESHRFHFNEFTDGKTAGETIARGINNVFNFMEICEKIQQKCWKMTEIEFEKLFFNKTDLI